MLEEKRMRSEGVLPAPSPKRARADGPVRQRDWLDGEAGDEIEYAELCWGAQRTGRKSATPEPLPYATQGLPAAALQDGPTVAGLVEGTVVDVAAGLCRVAVSGEQDRQLLCTIRHALRTPASGLSNVVAVGDRVLVAPLGAGGGVVAAVLPRRSVLARPDVCTGHLQQVIVANADQLLVIASWREPAFWPELVDRYLIAAHRVGLRPALCINKVDLAAESGEIVAVESAYADAGVLVFSTSVPTEKGIEAVRNWLNGAATVLAGLSGVGKSSLLQAAYPTLNLKTGSVSARRHEGRHTTTQSSLHPLPGGGFVADTPGIREFGLVGLAGSALPGCYPEFASHAAHCAFANCSHLHEPGCAVRAAVREGRLSRMRYDSYRKIRDDLATRSL